MRAHDQVRVPEAPRLRAVGADAADLAGDVEDELRRRVLEEAFGVLPARQVVVGASCGEDVPPVPFEAFDEMRAEKAAGARDQGLHAGVRVGVSQSTRPIQRARLSAYHAIVRAIPSSHETRGSQPVSRFSFSYPTRRAITSLAPGR